MATLNTDIFDPAALTEFMRELYIAKEEKDGVLSAFLPNYEVDGATVDVVVEGNTPAEPAKRRAFDAEPRFGTGVSKVTRTIKLMPLSEQGRFGEQEAVLTGRNSTAAKEAWIKRRAARMVDAYFERLEQERANLLLTGRLTINQDDLKIDESFGRPSSHDVTAGTLWNAGGNPLEDITLYAETYAASNFGAQPGTILTSRRILRQLAKHSAFATALAGGGSRPAGLVEINDVLLGQGLPTLQVFDKATAAGRLIPDDRLIFLPDPGEKFSSVGSELGGTPWGTTASAFTPSWGIDEADAAGLVAAVFENSKPPVGLEIAADAIALPVLANASRSLVAKVL